MRQCATCGMDLPDRDFAWKNKKKGMRQSSCRECFAIMRKERKAKMKKKVDNYKSFVGCKFCGIDDKLVLTFCNQKIITKTIGNMNGWSATYETLTENVVVCQNCQIIHEEELKGLTTEVIMNGGYARSYSSV